MDRELLLEIGCEELPASWLPGLTTQIGEVVVAQLQRQRLPPEAPVETYSTPRRLTVRIARLAERQTDLEELVNGPPVSASFKPTAAPTPAADRLCGARTASTSRALERVETPKGRVSRLPQEAARQGGGRRAARRAGGDAARPHVPEADALGRDARRRRRRAAVRPTDPLDPLSLRRPRRAVHDRAHAGGAERPGAGRDVRAPSPTATGS